MRMHTPVDTIITKPTTHIVDYLCKCHDFTHDDASSRCASLHNDYLYHSFSHHNNYLSRAFLCNNYPYCDSLQNDYSRTRMMMTPHTTLQYGIVMTTTPLPSMVESYATTTTMVTWLQATCSHWHDPSRYDIPTRINIICTNDYIGSL